MQEIFRETFRTLNASTSSNLPEQTIFIFHCTLPWWPLFPLSHIQLHVFKISSDVAQHCHLRPSYRENRTHLPDVYIFIHLHMSCIKAQALDPFQGYFVSMHVSTFVHCWSWSADFSAWLQITTDLFGDHWSFGSVCESAVGIEELCALCWWRYCHCRPCCHPRFQLSFPYTGDYSSY